jgi:hypothetical protein
VKKGFHGLPMFVWILLGLLGIASALLSLGQRDDKTNPAANSYGPSGTSAFAELLKRNGYDVRVDRRPRPRLAPDEVAVAFEVSGVSPFTSGDNEEEFEKTLLDQVRAGRRAVLLTLPADFQSESKGLLPSPPVAVLVRGRPKDLKVKVPAVLPAATHGLDEDADVPQVGLWDTPDENLARAYQVGKGRLVHARSGSFVTNRFLDQADDARAAMELVGLLARPGERIVFTEAAFGNVDSPSLVEVIGAWANAAWQQLLFLGVVVVYTLGKRFGIPEETRIQQRGARELLDALTDTLFRGRQTRVAMAAALDRANTELRSALRLPRDATRPERDRHLPPPLAGALARLQAATEMEGSTPAPQALELIVKVRTLTDEFLGVGRRRAR